MTVGKYNNISLTVSALMSNVLTFKFGMTYCLTGKNKEKDVFQKTKLFNIVSSKYMRNFVPLNYLINNNIKKYYIIFLISVCIEAALKLHETDSASEKTVETVIGTWLTNCKIRNARKG